MNASGYLSILLNLLPRGRAWPRSPDSMTAKLLNAFADGAAAFDAKLMELLENADPRTTLALVGAWERTVGLPDETTGVLTDIDDRRAAIWQRLTSTGGQSKPYFTEVASRLGYTVTINGYKPTACGDRLGARCYGTHWRFTWKVTVHGALAAPVLEAVFQKLKPADSAVIFAYEA